MKFLGNVSDTDLLLALDDAMRNGKRFFALLVVADPPGPGHECYLMRGGKGTHGEVIAGLASMHKLTNMLISDTITRSTDTPQGAEAMADALKQYLDLTKDS